MTVTGTREHREGSRPVPPLRRVQVAQSCATGLIATLLVAMVFLACRGSALADFQEPDPPDVVVVVVADALRADRLSCWGYAGNRTPHVDALASDGVLYRHMSTQASWTKPSIATLLTSLYPSTHQTCVPEDILPDAVLTLPEIMSAQGYHTVGFVNNYNLFSYLNFDQGYRAYYDLGADASTQSLDGKKFYQEAELVNQHVLAWLETECQKPGVTRFFMYVHYMEPHRPYFEHPYNGNAVGYHHPRPDQADALSDTYDGEIAYFDKHFGNLIAALKRLGLYENALIVFTSDHGEEFYEHQGWFHGKTLYQELTHVPLIVKYPGGARAGTVDEGLARTLDIAPTILDVANIEVPATMQGVSLRQPSDSPARAPFSFAETFYMTRSRAVRTLRYKLIEVADGDLRGRAPTQLYDLESDPGATTNLAMARPDLVARLRTDMSRTLALAEEAAVGGQETELDPAFRERLRQLGY